MFWLQIVKWLNHQRAVEPKKIIEEEMREFDEFETDFFKDMDFGTELAPLVMAVNNLDIPQLLDACLTHIAMQIKGKSISQIRQNLNIKPEVPVADTDRKRPRQWLPFWFIFVKNILEKSSKRAIF